MIKETERYEQEVTINLENEGPENQAVIQAELVLQFEETVKKVVNLEVSSFFMDYGFHIVNQLIGIVSTIIFKLLDIENELMLGVACYFAGSILALILRLLRRKSDSKIKKYVVILEILSNTSLIASIYFFQSPAFFLTFLVYSALIFAQIIFYCLNFADSIDQTFVFKLVSLVKQAINFPKIVMKFQIFLAFLKVSSHMTSLWINLLTPTWLFGSAAIGCFIYTFFFSILKLAWYLFHKKNKEESSRR